MIKPEELRIGNLVACEMLDGVKHVEVESINHRGINLSVDFGSISPDISFENIEGIDITGELLLKFGFRKMNSPLSRTIFVLWIDDTTEIEIEKDVEDEFIVTLILTYEDFNRMQDNVAYKHFRGYKVHNLQGLHFVLTGKQLKV